MNREEWSNNGHKQNFYYRYVHKLLNDWKHENNIQEAYDVHHRDDTEDCRKYNAEHYELWGCEICSDGSIKFELGKYVCFMLHSQHTHYHHVGKNYRYGYKHSLETRNKMSTSQQGDKNHMFGKNHTAEARRKMSEARKGHKISAETREKIRAAQKGEKSKLFGKKLSAEHKQKMRESMQKVVEIYKKYKQNGGELVWHDFRRALKNNEINIE